MNWNYSDGVLYVLLNAYKFHQSIAFKTLSKFFYFGGWGFLANPLYHRKTLRQLQNRDTELIKCVYFFKGIRMNSQLIRGRCCEHLLIKEGFPCICFFCMGKENYLSTPTQLFIHCSSDLARSQPCNSLFDKRMIFINSKCFAIFVSQTT